MSNSKDNDELDFSFNLGSDTSDDTDFDFDFDDEETKQQEVKAKEETRKTKGEKKNVIQKENKEDKKTNKTKENASNKSTKTQKTKMDKKDKKAKSKETKEKADKPKKKARGSKVEGKKKNPVKTVIIVVGIIIIIGGKFGLTALKSSNQHITVAENPPEVNTTQNETLEENNNTAETEEIKVVADKEINETPTKGKLSLGDTIIIKTIVNTKLVENGDTEYKDYNASASVTLDSITTGYDKVIEFVNKYNEVSSNIIQLDSKEDFYTNYPDYELVMYSVRLSIPKDFPTQDTEEGKTTLKPELALKLQGADKENKDKIITDRYEYKIPETTSITIGNSEFIRGNEYEYKWIAILPKGISADTHNIKIKYSDNNETNKTYTYTGQAIQ